MAFAGAARRRCAGHAGGSCARADATLGGDRSRAGRQRAARIRRGVRAPDAAGRRTGPDGRRRRPAGADRAQPRAADRALGPHVPGGRYRRAVLGSCVVVSSSRYARWPSPSRSAAEACPGGYPVFRDPGDDDPGDPHCASRPAAPSTLIIPSPTAASARQPSRAAHATPIACAGTRLSLRSEGQHAAFVTNHGTARKRSQRDNGPLSRPSSGRSFLAACPAPSW